MNHRHIAAALGASLFVGVLAAYIETMAGSASFWDCGEFIATAYTLGIPHPPATPLYVVLGRVFTLLPLPLTIAQKVNFMSAFFGALGIVVLFWIVADLVRERRGPIRTWLDAVVVFGSALVGALFTAWSNAYWTNAVEAEVYSISSFVMGVTTLLARRWARRPEVPESTRSIYLIIYLMSLGVGFHLGTVLTYPAIALYLLFFRKRSFRDLDLFVFSFGFFLFLFHVNLKFGGVLAGLCLLLFLLALTVLAVAGRRFALTCTALFVLGISIHLFLYIRSGQNPAIDEADPETWANLWAVLRREQYPPSKLFVRKASWSFQIFEHFGGYFRQQWELVQPGGPVSGARLAWIPILMGVAGLVSLYQHHRRNFVLLFGTFLITSLGMIVVLNFSASEVRDRDYFYSPAFYFYGVFIGVGAAALLDWFFGARAQRGGLDRLGYLAGMALFLAMTAMLYHRYHFEHDRTRERVPWGYGYNMLAGLEPHALIFTNGDNDTFPLWYQQEVEKHRYDVRVVNLSLLNTDWYLRQLRDNDPKVALSWTDAQIGNLPLEAYRAAVQTNRDLQPRDLAVRQIVRDNFGKRPIYFAVTIPQDALRDVEEYLVLEGLVYRLTNERRRGRRDYAKIEHNATQVYRYDGILTADGKHDSSLYRDPNQESLVQNYASAFIRLAQHAEDQADAAADAGARRDLQARAVDNYLRALEISPGFHEVGAQLANLYQRMGQHAEAVARYEDIVRRAPRDDRWRLYLASAYLGASLYDDALRELRELHGRAPNDETIAQYLVQVLSELERGDEAQSVIAAWESRRPGDTALREFYQQVRSGVIGSLILTEPEGEGVHPLADSAGPGFVPVAP